MEWTSTWAGIIEFLKSPGFAAAGAVLAASLAYRAASRKTAWDAWWERAQWALDRAGHSDPLISQSGLAALLALVEEEGGDPAQKDWLRAAALAFLPLQAGDPLAERDVGDLA